MKPTRSLSIKSRIIIVFLIGLFSVRAMAESTAEFDRSVEEVRSKDFSPKQLVFVNPSELEMTR